ICIPGMADNTPPDDGQVLFRCGCNISCCRFIVSWQTGAIALAGWVERRETHHLPQINIAMGFATLCPSYAYLAGCSKTIFPDARVHKTGE
ncbi:MAG: hypothetical protein FWF12_10550, partial [Betaproteobacteria bacterium]|nr:hypothetical protein [Betaproteobacteria bacterium]